MQIRILCTYIGRGCSAILSFVVAADKQSWVMKKNRNNYNNGRRKDEWSTGYLLFHTHWLQSKILNFATNASVYLT